MNTPGELGGGGLGGHKFKSLSNWHQLSFTSADSSGNGHRLNTFSPQYHRGIGGGGVRGSQIQKSRQALKRLDRLTPTLVFVCGFVWDAKYNSPLNTPGALGGGGGGYEVIHSKLWGRYQTAAPIGTKFGTHVQIHLGMDIAPRDTRGVLGFFLGVKHSTVWGSCQTATPIGTNFGTRRRLRLGMDIG